MQTTIKPQNGTKFTNIEKKQIKDAERIANKIKKLYKEGEALFIALGANPFTIKKGVKVSCNVETEQVANRVVFKFDCIISLPEEIVK